MEYSKLDEKAINSFRRGKGIALAVMSIVAAVMIFIGAIFDEQVVKLVLIIAGIVIEVIFIALFIIYPPLEYRQWKYGISDDRVEIEHGIFFISRTIIPIIRIQNITLSQGPINRQLDLFDVDIAIASGSESIPCLSRETADEISRVLKDRIYKRLEENERQDVE